MDRNKLAGREGEAMAAEYLRRRGYAIVGQNFSCRQGEIDVIASRAGYIAFVEVKLRANANFAQAREFVNAAKQRRIRTAASVWLSRNETELQPRFDVIEIYTDPAKPVINHIENAFE